MARQRQRALQRRKDVAEASLQFSDRAAAIGGMAEAYLGTLPMPGCVLHHFLRSSGQDRAKFFPKNRCKCLSKSADPDRLSKNRRSSPGEQSG